MSEKQNIRVNGYGLIISGMKNVDTYNNVQSLFDAQKKILTYADKYDVPILYHQCDVQQYDYLEEYGALNDPSQKADAFQSETFRNWLDINNIEHLVLSGINNTYLKKTLEGGDYTGRVAKDFDYFSSLDLLHDSYGRASVSDILPKVKLTSTVDGVLFHIAKDSLSPKPVIESQKSL